MHDTKGFLFPQIVISQFGQLGRNGRNAFAFDGGPENWNCTTWWLIHSAYPADPVSLFTDEQVHKAGRVHRNNESPRKKEVN